ncbi:hypothetical protein [Natrinema sp. DC36]|uniref:hypothetical protein n=1 Tax=Natrinema sp. DC36 TaxID=2878680 RepID=UPI001CEFF485|nr:hypothetical protein [Natrinema sp. DC36]
MISLEAREAMDELDTYAEENLDDMRKYSPRRDFFETALDEVTKYGTEESLEEIMFHLKRLIENGKPPDRTRTFRSARNVIREQGGTLPDHSPLHRG